MCHACVMETVKERMLSRRDFFKGSATVAAGAAAVATASAVAPLPASAANHSSIVDLSHTTSPEFPTYFGQPGISIESAFNFAENGFNVFNISHNEHVGTHVDAPLHFSADGQAVDEIPVENLVAPLVVVDVREAAAENPDYELTPDDLQAWMDANGDMPERCCVAMLSGWGDKTATDEFRGADADGVQHYPGFHIEAAQMLLENTTAIGIASDTLSLDTGKSTTFETHYAWLPTNRWGIENIANLDQLPASGATIIVGAPKIGGGSGGPSRVLAMV
ncbi:MAG: cyclase family protein [Pseudomonadota bacterium]